MVQTSDIEWFCDENRESFDAIVVGSGYGGSVAACRMSMAGIKVCLIEKGRRWEAKDFPTDSFQLMSSVRIEMRNWGVSFGPKDALIQIHVQDDSLAGVTCGLGGGSLVNAGVMVSTPVRTRKNPKWPKDWKMDWEVCEASALAMLRPQSVPIEFANAKVMRQISEDIEESSMNSIKLTMNFDHEEGPSSKGTQQLGNCLACGNCMSGCPYNAKNSTDKNYLESAIQAGCIVKTGCEVQYVVKNPDEDYKERGGIRKKQQRRWRVYFDNLEYMCCDFVILSAGVLGTAEILLKSERRGLRLSEKLGFGFSCNGNNVAYVAGSRAPLNAYGLNKKQFSKVPFQDRPGPTISSSYTSSLGFTIQSGVLPTAYPYLLFKGISTYGWPSGYWLIHGIIDKWKHILGLKSSQSMVLNAMGYDASDGRITLDKVTDKICFTPPHDPLLPRKIQAFQKITKRLGAILFMSRYRSSSVHLLGGCNAASDPSHGVCNPTGQVFDPRNPSPTAHRGLYVCDASMIPCSVGINPCLTIATAAEYVSRHLVQDVLKYKSLNRLIPIPVKESKGHASQKDGEFVDKSVDLDQQSGINSKSGKGLRSSSKVSMRRTSKMVTVREIMRGYVGAMPCTAYLIMKMNSGDQKGWDEGSRTAGGPHPLLRGKVGGYIEFPALQKDKLYVIDGKVDMCSIDSRTPYTQYMCYQLLLASASGSRFILEGKKIMNPYLLASYAWRESRTMHVTLKTIHQIDNIEHQRCRGLTEETVNLKGELHLSTVELVRSLISMTGNQKRRFINLLLRSLFRTYILQTPRSRHVDFGPLDMNQRPYPPCIHHEMKTDDGFIISCKQWRCSQNTWRSEVERRPYPVLLLNGHSTESYYLPTEPKDLVRTLLEEGFETWLLQPRLHPLNPSNEFTIEDVGKFDIPAVLAKIFELHGPSAKAHVIAHCVGGLAIHIALLGGHISATHIASLSCTNSSMFFKLTTSSLVKMRLPLIPISMAILGKNRILPMFESSKDSFRHRLLKSVACLIPRYERCTCIECEVFSGIFGNTFWHNNISHTMHHWMNKQSLPRLPMSAFPHLRKICITGFIVDSNGKNSYLIHPERMALPTLYISGGRSLLVTPQTSFLANQYMRMHQPGFHHTRVVVDGFGHSDLLIGENSYKKVFPHIISHLRLVEQGSNGAMNMIETNYSKESLSWANAEDGEGGFGTGVFVILLLLFLLMVIMFSSCM
ncbi:uncharacterized protein LOC143866499 [Tasmannia lanceolata]|uniref:uncharacterized protein LOC143863558 n=1 Tax=Tasmannia lanceolata TaxID=3420 RepID=UPI004062F7DE